MEKNVLHAEGGSWWQGEEKRTDQEENRPQIHQLQMPTWQCINDIAGKEHNYWRWQKGEGIGNTAKDRIIWKKQL